MITHRNMKAGIGKLRKAGSMRSSQLQPGSFLLELVVASVLLLSIGLFVFKSSVDLLSPRQAVLHQNLSDAYMSYEEAYAARISFEELTSNTSPWPELDSAASPTTITVNIGSMPGTFRQADGSPPIPQIITGTLTRIRTPDPNNLSENGTLDTNPAEMETWILESHLEYQIGDETYTKSRTISRTQ